MATGGVRRFDSTIIMSESGDRMMSPTWRPLVLMNGRSRNGSPESWGIEASKGCEGGQGVPYAKKEAAVTQAP